jgi:hypothetical protein
MIRYIALAWDPLSSRQNRAANLARERLRTSPEPWITVLDRAGAFAAVVKSGNIADCLRLRDQGVLFGITFPRRSEVGCVARTRTLSEQEVARIIDTDCRSLVDDRWGSYVAFLRSRSGDRTLAFRGPMSTLPCFYSTVDGVVTFYSLVEDFTALNLVRPTINWDCIRAQAANGDYLCHETAINEVMSLECGELARMDSRGLSFSTYWDPRLIAQANEIQDFREAADVLRQEDSPEAWPIRAACTWSKDSAMSRWTCQCFSRAERRRGRCSPSTIARVTQLMSSCVGR